MIAWMSAGILLFLALSLWVIPVYGVHRMTLSKRQSYKKCFELMEEFQVFTKQEFDELDKEEVNIKSNDGLKLFGTYIEKYPYSNRVAIIVHGYTAAMPWSSQFSGIFMKKGFNILLIDQRAHGQSEGKYATFGYKEKYDIQAWVDWTVNRKGEDCVIALHGQSLGGGTVLEYAAIHRPQVRLVVADCPYSDLTELVRHQVASLNFIPSWPFINLINRRLKTKAGFRMEDVSPIQVMEACKLPIMFVHGGSDLFVPTKMSVDLYHAKPEPKRLLIVDGATHGVAHCRDRERYVSEICDFVEQVVGPATAEDMITLDEVRGLEPVSATDNTVLEPQSALLSGELIAQP
ncbi:alpha/beta hydrolase [Paenibacillus marinisediminis]